VRSLPGFNTYFRFLIMLTNTRLCYFPELLLSFARHDIRFSKFHLVINLLSLSRSLTYLLLITTELKQNRHELKDISVFLA